ncbi:unnamed protein product [Aphanomyces euteiches]
MHRSTSSLEEAAERTTAIAYKSQQSAADDATHNLVDVNEESSSDDKPSWIRRKWFLVAVAALVLLAAAGTAAVVIVLTKSSTGSSGGSNSSSSTSSSTSAPSTTPLASGNTPSTDGTTSSPSSDGGSTSSNSSSTKPSSLVINPPSDPETSKAVLTMLAIGDWGSTTGKASGIPGSCCKLYKTTGAVDTSNPRYKVDFWSQKYVATLLGLSAAEIHPVRVIGHGDNVYWNGVGSLDWQYRFEETFEKIYDAPALAGVKWVNVAGNHDIGGSAFLCGEQDNLFAECTSTADLLKHLNARFDLQAQYKSPNQNRWLMTNHYYVERVSQSGVAVEIFNIDTNYADSHGARQVCCQCYGYSQKYGYDSSTCNNVVPGDKACAGGNMDMYNACMNEITGWAEDSYSQAARDLAASTATYKIINTHYSPHFHMTPEKMATWYKLCKDMNVSAWFNGHTHGFNHDIASWGTHFFENGGGGGIVSETSTGAQNANLTNAWVAAGNPYGFMELIFSPEWLKVQFVTFDTTWQFGGMDLSATVQGGLQRGHCWFVPNAQYVGTQALGQKCKSSVDGAIGAPIR